MKKTISFFLFLIAYFLLLITTVSAATPTLSPTPQVSSTESQINKLKDRIASRVAELKLVERRGIIGNATEISGTQIVVSDTKKNIRFIDVDELTKFSSPSAKGTFGISDIEKGKTLGVLGLYNKQTRRLLARFVNILIIPQVIHGTVASLDAEEFTLTIATEEKQITADMQTTTKTSIFTKEDGLIKSGFSKIKEGSRIMIVGFPDLKDNSRIQASRIIIFPKTPVNPKIKAPGNTTPSPTASP